jgi:hypothetical protein
MKSSAALSEATFSKVDIVPFIPLDNDLMMPHLAYREVKDALQDVPIAHCWELASMLESPSFSVARAFMEELPLVRLIASTVGPAFKRPLAQIYFAVNAAAGRVPFQFAVMTSMESAMSRVRWRCRYVLGSGERSLSEIMSRVKDLYTSLEIIADPTADGLPYPHEGSGIGGMSIELR